MKTGNRAETARSTDSGTVRAVVRTTLRDAPTLRRSSNAANQGECRDEPEEVRIA